MGTEDIQDHNIKIHEERLNDHSARLKNLETSLVSATVQLENIREDIASLVTMLRYFLTLFCGSLVAFFFYVIQRYIN